MLFRPEPQSPAFRFNRSSIPTHTSTSTSTSTTPMVMKMRNADSMPLQVSDIHMPNHSPPMLITVVSGNKVSMRKTCSTNAKFVP